MESSADVLVDVELDTSVLGGRLPGHRITEPPRHDEIGITVDDNGKGLPIENRDSLTEPYVTSRSKGTGLGLAIVKKIMEDHGGRLTLDDGPEGGARIGLILSATTKEEPASPPAPRPV